MDDNQLAKIAKNEKQTSSGHLDGLQNVAAEVGYRRHRKTGRVIIIRRINNRATASLTGFIEITITGLQGQTFSPA